MRTKIRSMFLCMMMVITVFVVVPTNVSAYFAGGNGTAGNPYQISDVYQLQNMKYDLDAHYILVNDIDATETISWNSGKGFVPVGEYTGDPYYGIAFTGSFDGNGYEIINLFIYRPAIPKDPNLYIKHVGLFGHIDGSIIKDVALLNANITGDYYVGGLVGSNYGGTISNSYTTGSVRGCEYVGGIVGRNRGLITNSYSSAYVYGYEYKPVETGYEVGGLVGENDYDWKNPSIYGVISNSYATGDVLGDWQCGGLVGGNWASISNCYATGIVKGQAAIGGLAGFNVDGSITRSYSTGNVIGIYFNWGATYYYPYVLGGLVGENYDASISMSYALGSVSGDLIIGGLVGINKGGQISRCFATGNVNGIDEIGGLVGKSYNSRSFNSIISNSYATGNVIATGDKVGGLVGNNEEGSILNCYSTGSVSGNLDVGGLVGDNYLGIGPISSSYWDIQTSGQFTSDGGIGRTTALMKKQSTFVGWDFFGIWTIQEDVTYPYFRGASQTKILPIAYSYQGNTSWCWANSMSMALQYYGHHVHPWDIAEYFDKGHDDGISKFDYYDIRDYFYQYYNLQYKRLISLFFSFEDIKEVLDDGHPVMYMASIAPPGGTENGHAIIITGYRIEEGGKYFYVNDPSGYFVDTCWGLSSSEGEYINIQVPANYLFSPSNEWFCVIKGTPSPTTSTITLIDDKINKTTLEWEEDIGPILWLDRGLTWKWRFDEKPWEPDDNLPFPSNSGLEFGPYIYNIDKTSHFYQLDIIIENEFTEESITYHITKCSMGSDIQIYAESCSRVIVSYQIDFQLYPNFYTEGWYNIDLELWDSNPDYNDPNDLYDRITNIRFRIDDEEYVESLTEYVIENVVELDIHEGTENSLISKLENALSSFEKGQNNAAINKLEAFINEVEAQRGKKLIEEEADTLIVYAQTIINYYTVL